MGFKKINSSSIKLPEGTDLLMQTYEPAPLPDGVKMWKVNVFPDDWGGTFKELIRLDEDGKVMALKELGIDFKIRQVSMSIIVPGKKMFWHLHPERDGRPGQSEMWMVNSTLLLGMIDLRTDSPTYGLKSKVTVYPDRTIYIPAGIAHGLINPTNTTATLVYFMDRQFEASEETLENRIDPTKLPYDFVEPEVM